MNWRLVFRLLGLLALLIGGAMVASLPWSHPWCGQARQFEALAFRGMLLSIFVCTVTGGLLIFAGRKPSGIVLRKEALAVVGLGWILSGFLGSLPYLLTPTYRLANTPMSLADAMFESVSGFSTTGASVLTDLELPEGVDDCEAAAIAGDIAWVPRSVLFWRSFTHWLGGMGIIVLFVAILGQLGVGGKALMRREVPGPITDSVRPRVRETAIIMWAIYMGLSAILTLTLLLLGMDLYESLCHSFGTMATGGFSTRNASIGSFQSAELEFTLIVFMLAAGTNFNLYYFLLRPVPDPARTGFLRRLRRMVGDPEFRVYVFVVTLASLAMAAILFSQQVYPTVTGCLRHACFNIVAVMTTTGFGTENFAIWPHVGRALLLLLMFVGGCSGSTGGGVKVIRVVVLAKVLFLEAERAFRPNLVRPVRLAGTRVAESVGRDVLVYVCLISVIFATSWLALVAMEPPTQWENQADVSTSKLADCAGAVASALNNIGPGLGICGPHGNYTAFSDPGKTLLTLLMLLGRLELFAIIVLFVPGFWKLQ